MTPEQLINLLARTVGSVDTREEDYEGDPTPTPSDTASEEELEYKSLLVVPIIVIVAFVVCCCINKKKKETHQPLLPGYSPGHGSTSSNSSLIAWNAGRVNDQDGAGFQHNDNGSNPTSLRAASSSESSPHQTVLNLPADMNPAGVQEPEDAPPKYEEVVGANPGSSTGANTSAEDAGRRASKRP